jgi:hypothetical protein
MDVNYVLVVLTVVLVILNIILLSVTIAYLRHTKQMTTIMALEFEMRISPILVVDSVSSTNGPEKRSYQPIITNKGSLPIKVKAAVMEWWRKERPSEIHKKEKIVDRMLGVGESTRYGECEITIKEADMRDHNSEDQRHSDLNGLLRLFQGKLYCTYVDVNAKEQRTRDLRFWETM